MKMENVIKASADATVTSIEVEKGKTVDKNQVMIRFA
jgi:biotin carboxyl carrier protein